MTGLLKGAVTAFCAMLGLATVAGGAAQAGEVNVGYFGDVAIEGYDAVAYFTQKKAVKGTTDNSYKWLGATWLFSSPENRDLFSRNPISYAPQYGGHCADGVGYGQKTVNIDPSAFRIIDGKLYLNHDPGAAVEIETLPEQLKKADENWVKLRSELLAQD